jgi:hypothetical protein
MDTFKDMSIGNEGQEKTQDAHESSIWGPDDYEKIYRGHQPQRSHTAMAGTSHVDSGYATGFDGDSDPQAGPSQLDDYIPRMERRLRELQDSGWKQRQSEEEDPELRPPIPAKNSDYDLRDQANRPRSAFGIRKGSSRLRKQKSALELGRDVLSRTFTTKSTVTTTTNSSNQTERSLMSASSIGNYSVKSAGSFYRKKLGIGVRNEAVRPMSSIDFAGSGGGIGGGVGFTNGRPQTSLTNMSFHSSNDVSTGASAFGGLVTPSPKKRGFLGKMVDSARATAATARSTLSTSRPSSPTKMSSMPGIAGGAAVQSRPQSSAARDMGLGSIDWVQVRRDLYRSNSLSRNERQERLERCQMLDIPVICPVEELHQCSEGGEGLDGLPVSEPVDFASCNLSLVDKSARFVNNLPPSTTPAGLVQGYLCRPYRSDVQRLRAIFTWVSERISWEDDFEGEINIRRVMQTKRGCSEEIAHLVTEMCTAAGVHSEIIHGLLKIPGEPLDLDLISRPNHWWNAVIVDGEWRIMDCSLASPTNPRRVQFSTIRSQGAEPWWFLTSPLEACYSHVPLIPEHQHVIPPVSNDVLLSLPCVCPAYFQHYLEIHDFNTSLLHLENLELAHLYFYVPEDVECVAEIEVRAFARDADGDLFENGDVVRTPALSQAEWFGGRKRFAIKALLPGDEGQGILKIYAGKRGLMVRLKSPLPPHTLTFNHSTQ